MALPATVETGVMQERVGWPSTRTVHEPHTPMPQPNFVPGQAQLIAQHPEQEAVGFAGHRVNPAVDR